MSDVRVIARGRTIENLADGEIFVKETGTAFEPSRFWVMSWDGLEAHDLSPRHPYETEAEAVEAAREALAQR